MQLLKKNSILFSLILLMFSSGVWAQKTGEQLAEQKALEQKIPQSKTVSERIDNAAKLAVFYSTYKDKQAVDSIIQLMFEWAITSGKKQDMFAAYRYAASPYSLSDFEKWKSYIQQGLDFAVKERLPNEEAFMLSFLARKYGIQRDFNKASEYYNRVDLNKEGIEDTTRYHYFYRKSEMYFVQKNILEGIKLLLSAKKYAEKSKVAKYIANINSALGQNYAQIKEYEKAISYFQAAKKAFENAGDLNNSIVQDLKIADTYRNLKKFTLAKGLYETVIKRCDSAALFATKYDAVKGIWAICVDQNEFHKVAAIGKKYKIADYYISTGDSASLYNVNAMYAEIESDHNSANLFYSKSIEYANKYLSRLTVAGYIYIHADYLKRSKRYEEALRQMQLALHLYDSLNIAPVLPNIYQNLDSIHTALGDYKNAWEARGNYYMCRDSLDNQNKKEDILKEELASEEESMKKAAEEEIAATTRKHNLQYTAIMIGGITLLISLLLLGFFNTPDWVIRSLGFISFIFLFEFIIVLLDSKLHHWFHGAPLPILAIKVLIACMLVPLHHFIEHKVIHFLQSKKLHRLKTVFKDEPVKDVESPA